ncbi:MAG: hypothetical protein I3273_04190 [Candidatus Moeniiplasma glomeromycotorum]|nr:hypothetical protein [Candidatus Moeniiplasma glomeromycotorum]
MNGDKSPSLPHQIWKNTLKNRLVYEKKKKKMDKTNQNQRNCRMCGIKLPPINSYESERCWMCCRRIWEKSYDRYYVKNGEFWEEVQSLRGFDWIPKENREMIEKVMDKEERN